MPSIGLYWLAHAGAAPIIVFAAATCYGLGKTFFWPTTLGVVSEQFPKGGALTLSAVAGVGMISVGVLGNPLLGTVQDKFLDQRLAAQNPALHEKITEPAQSKFGLTFQPLDKTKIADAARRGESGSRKHPHRQQPGHARARSPCSPRSCSSATAA